MNFWELLEVASMPIVQVLLISLLGAFMATDYLNLLNPTTINSMNKIVFKIFTPSLMFASLAKTVTFQDIISWWFMPVNIGLTFLMGGILGWIAVKILKPKPHLEGLIIATCSSGNLGNLLLIIIPAICSEKGSPFGDHDVCATHGLSYSSFSMALGGFYLWTYTYQLIRSSAMRYKAMIAAKEVFKAPNMDLNANEKAHLLGGEEPGEYVSIVVPTKSTEEGRENQVVRPPFNFLKVTAGFDGIMPQESAFGSMKEDESFWSKLKSTLHQILEELAAPPTLAAIVGFMFGAVPWLKHLVIGDNAPLRVIQDSIKLLGDGTIPCITLILGGNLTRGLRHATLVPSSIVAVICVRYVILPVIGIGVVKAAANLGILPSDPLFQFVLMTQFTLPPAMSIATVTELFDVAQAECSVLFLWTYLVAAFALTVWATIYMWILS
ncbi:hypothetical protein LguiB_032895 [Lonicera macranthoides]